MEDPLKLLEQERNNSAYWKRRYNELAAMVKPLLKNIEATKAPLAELVRIMAECDADRVRGTDPDSARKDLDVGED